HGTAGDARRERLPLEQLHDEIPFADIEERADVRMIELRDRLRFSLEAKLQLRIIREIGGKDLDGDAAIEPRVARAIDLAHASGTEPRDDFVRPEPCSLSEFHGSGGNDSADGPSALSRVADYFFLAGAFSSFTSMDAADMRYSIVTFAPTFSSPLIFVEPSRAISQLSFPFFTTIVSFVIETMGPVT